MATTSATIAGWAVRSNKAWFPSSGVASVDSMPSGVNSVVSSPVLNGTNNTSGNKYTTMIAVTTPNTAKIGSISKISITFQCYKGNNTSGTLYGSLRTVDQYSGSSSSDTLATYRVNAVGDEAALTFGGTSYVSKTMSFSGSFSKNTTYYLFLYTKSTNDLYYLQAGEDYFGSSITYTEKTYTVTFNANGGSGAPSAQTKYYSSNLTLSSTKPTKTSGSGSRSETFDITGNANGGYFGTTTTTTTKITATKKIPTTISYPFSHWNTKSDGTGTTYYAGGTYSSNSNVTLYAIYSTTTTDSTPITYSNNAISALSTPTRANSTVDTYTITYDANGGTCATASKDCAKTRKYTFKGWATTNNATSANAASTYTSAKTLYAYWTGADTTATATLPTPTRANYTFVGWATTADATSANAGNAGATYTPSGDITLYAVWAMSNSLIHYNYNNSDKICSVYYNDNGTAVLCNVYYNNNGTAILI